MIRRVLRETSAADEEKSRNVAGGVGARRRGRDAPRTRKRAMCSRRRRREPTRPWRTPFGVRHAPRATTPRLPAPIARPDEGAGRLTPPRPDEYNLARRLEPRLERRRGRRGHLASPARASSVVRSPSRAPHARERGRAPPQCPGWRAAREVHPARGLCARAPATGGKSKFRGRASPRETNPKVPS